MVKIYSSVIRRSTASADLVELLRKRPAEFKKYLLLRLLQT
jgi:hypothetical protein